MNIKKHLKSEEGFTIQEILVVLIVGSILVSVSLALFQFTNELFQRWYGSSEMKSDVQRILCTMSMDIQQSRIIISRTDTSLTLIRGIDRNVQYTFDGKVIRRNEVDLTPQKAIALLLKVNEERQTGSVSGIVSQYRLKILAQSKWISYESEMIAMIVPSSKSEFIIAR